MHVLAKSINFWLIQFLDSFPYEVEKYLAIGKLFYLFLVNWADFSHCRFQVPLSICY